MSKKEFFLACFSDAVANACYYDRKECEQLSREDVDELIEEGHVTASEIFDHLRSELVRLVNENFDVEWK